MVKEIVIYQLKPGQNAAFEQSFSEITPILRRQKGYLKDLLLHGIEEPDTYILEVEWQDMQAHQAFIASDDHPKLTGPIRQHTLEVKMAHYTLVVEG